MTPPLHYIYTMKPLLTPLLFLAVLCWNCDRPTPLDKDTATVTDTLTFTPFTFRDSTYLFPDDPENSPRYLVSVDGYAAAGPDTAINGLVNRAVLVGYLISASTAEEVPGRLREAFDTLAGEYLTAADGQTKEELMEFRQSYEQEYYATGQIVRNDPDTLVLSTYYYSYAGGAHGLGGTAYYNFNPRTGTEWTAETVFGEDNFPALRRYLYEEARRLTDNELLIDGPEEIEYLDNFALLPEGVLFVFNPYELAPYAMGMVEVLVPYEELP